MKQPLLFIAAAVFILAACSKQSDKAGQSTNATASSESSPLTAPVDYLGAVGKAQQTAVKTIDTSSITHAIDMFKIEQGRNPKTLDELVEEKYLGRIPDAPYGMKIEYDAQSGTVKVVKK